MFDFVNNYSGTVELTAGQLSVALSLPDGRYRLTVSSAPELAAAREIIDAEVLSGTATLTRGVESTVARAWPAGSVIYNALTASSARMIGALQLRATETALQGRYSDDAEWLDLVDMESLANALADTLGEMISPMMIPQGGRAGQCLVKLSDDDFDVGWESRALPGTPKLLAAAGSYGGSIYDAGTGLVIEGSGVSGASGFAFAGGGDILIDAANGIRLLSVKDWSVLHEIPTGWVGQFAVSSKKGFVFYAGSSGSGAFSVNSLSDIVPNDALPTSFRGVSVSASGEYVGYAENDEEMAGLYRTSDWSKIQLDVAALSTLNNSETMAITDDFLIIVNRGLKVFDTADGSFISVVASEITDIGGVIAVSDTHVATYTADDGINVYAFAGWSRESTFPALSGTVSAMAFSPDGSYLAVALEDATGLAVIKVSDWSIVSVSGATPEYCSRVVFSNDGSMLAVGSGSPAISMYKTSDWSVSTIDSSNGTPTAMALNF